MISVVNAISVSKTVLVVSHVKPDGDATGALIAMGMLLSLLGKNVTLYNESQIPELYCFVPWTDRVVSKIPETDFDTVILLDCASIDRVGSQLNRIQQIPTLINIDHHAMNSHYGIAWIDATFSSTSELVYQLAQELQAPITADFATAIYTGIMTDTSSFRNQNTTLHSFTTTVALLETGFSPSYVAEKIYGSYSVARLRMIRAVIEHMRLFEENRIWLSMLPYKEMKESGAQAEDTLGLIEYGKDVKTVQMAALAEEQPPESPFHYQVSLRTQSELDAAEFAKRFNGGGHPRAAGFSTNLSLDEIQTQLTQFVRESLNAS